MRDLPITAIVPTKNEERNLERCLAALKPARKVVVLDSHSQDRTPAIAKRFDADVVQFDYKGGYPKKRQWALDTLPITTEWVLLLDADEVVPGGLWQEIGQAITGPMRSSAFLITKGFHFLGRRFRFGGFSFDAVLLFRHGRARFEQILEDPPGALDMEVHERIIVDGPVGRLKTPLIHEDFKSLEAYIERHNQYSTWEARLRDDFLRSGRWGADSIRANLWGNVQERRRFLKALAVRIPFEPQLWFVYHFFIKCAFLEGRRGLIASRFRSDYVSQVRAKLFELKTISRGVRSDAEIAIS